jgi:uncharacterized protein
MKIALIGASGNVGSRILKELTDRGYQVTAIVRHPEKVAKGEQITVKHGDVHDRRGLTELLKGHDIVISSIHFTASDPEVLISAAKDSGTRRYLVVGGAGSLEVAPGVALVTTAEFPAAYKPEAEAGARFLELLRKEESLDWTFISPSALFEPGTRTGMFRLGRDQLLSDDKGSRISFEDFAVALVNEIEKPAHRRQRFTVGY